MKRLIKFPAIALGLLLFFVTTEKAIAQYDDVSLQTFYDELSPYGTWINDPQYGYVWRPDVDQREFRPYYSNGRWAMTEYGNTWVSNYDWGWAPFHYGRWTHNRYNNWVWIPGTVWGPAWVNWRSGVDHYGWAPMGPSNNIHMSSHYVTPDFYWNFVPARNIYHHNYPRYYSGRNRVYIQNTIIINNTYVRNNNTYYTGPRTSDIRRATNQEVKIYDVARTTRRNGNGVENNQVNIYAPRPTRGVSNAEARPRAVIQGNVSREKLERGDAMAQQSGRAERGSYSGVDQIKGEKYSERNVDHSNVTGIRRGIGQTNSRGGQREMTNDSAVYGRSRGNGTTTIDRRGSASQQPTAAPQQERNNPYAAPSRTSSSERNRATQSAPVETAPQQRSAERSATQRPQRIEQSLGFGISRGSTDSKSATSSRSEGGSRPGRG